MSVGVKILIPLLSGDSETLVHPWLDGVAG